LWARYHDLCTELVKQGHYKSVGEVGGGRYPALELDVVRSLGLDYTVIDVSADELELVPDGYSTLQVDMCDPAAAELGEKFDFIFSRMAAEHMRDGEAMHRNVLALLRPGGEAFHVFPTLYSPVFVANRLLPKWASDRLLDRYAPREQPKFKAYYSLCRGPSRRTLRRLTQLGFIVAEYRPFYGHDYFQQIPLLRKLDDQLSAWAARRRNPHFTSYVWLRLRKPGPDEGPYRTR
jgi:SAM-dependent methyltransferase